MFTYIITPLPYVHSFHAAFILAVNDPPLSKPLVTFVAILSVTLHYNHVLLIHSPTQSTLYLLVSQDGASLPHKTPPHPWPDIFRKSSKDLDTARERSDRQSPCTPTSGPDGSSENVAATMTSSVLEIDFVDNDAEELFNQTP